MAPAVDQSSVPYRRLGGRGRRTSGCVSVGASISTIWLAEDHLLVRESIYGMSETYKRFYFRDVQVIIVRRTQKWIGWICVWTFCALLFFFWYVAAGWRSAALGFFWPSLCFVLAMIQLARGPSCVTHLVTAVQRELLASLNTVRKARRALKILVPLIEEKQGKFEPELPGSSAAAPIQSAPSSARPVSITPPPRAVLPPGRNRVHFLLFGTTLAGGAAALWETFRSSTISLTATSILLVAIIVLSVITLVHQGKRPVAKGVAAITWTIMVGYIVAWLVIYTAYTMVYSIQKVARPIDHAKPPPVIDNSELTPAILRQLPGFDYVLFIYGAFSAALGVAGIGAIFLGRSTLKQPPPLPGQID